MLRRLVQGSALLLFLLTLWLAWPGALLLRLDPLAAPGVMLADRTLLPALWPGLAILATALLAGRLFCGWICPLGTTIDLADRACNAARARTAAAPLPRRLNRAVLAAVAAGAVLGVSWLVLTAPLALATRLYGLIVTPLLAQAGNALLTLTRPLADAFQWKGLQFLIIPAPHHATLWVQALFFLALLGAGAWLGPRLWCRHLCPAGALLGLCTSRVAISRQVRQTCIGCGKCQAHCPMQAIPEDPFRTRHEDCILCQGCAHVCPVAAVTFGAGATPAEPVTPTDRRNTLRTLGKGVALGAGAAMLARLELATPLAPPGVGELPSTAAIRPPGALPERAFLARCVRCGLCMTVCPTNTLQPLWTEAGAAGLFSPVLTPRRGPCEPGCHRCGQVCPTRALLPLPLAEKQAVKVGTARVLRHRCLAWEEDKACLVCDEVCPYDAVELIRQPGLAVAVPVVREERCAGCGFCEFHCPVRAERAIVVEPASAVRLEHGAYLEENRALGLDIQLAVHRPPPSLPSEFGTPSPLPDAHGGLPPGFSDPE